MSHLKYPKTLNKKIWENYLKRDLSEKEMGLLATLKTEMGFNKRLVELYEIALTKNLYIPFLTNLYGNCLFESLNYLGICQDQDDLRKTLAYLLYIYRDHKNLFKNETRTLAEMFRDTNEIEYVYCKKEERIYKYTYDTMCQDLASEFSWTRLPMQIIIMFISLLFNIQIEIISNTNAHVHSFSMTENPSSIVYLGHIGETHYVPLAVRKGNKNEDICPEYGLDTKKEFAAWAKKMENQVQLRYYYFSYNNNYSNYRGGNNSKSKQNYNYYDYNSDDDEYDYIPNNQNNSTKQPEQNKNENNNSITEENHQNQQSTQEPQDSKSQESHDSKSHDSKSQESQESQDKQTEQIEQIDHNKSETKQETKQDYSSSDEIDTEIIQRQPVQSNGFKTDDDDDSDYESLNPSVRKHFIDHSTGCLG